MCIEEWHGKQVRFIEKDGQWWAVAKDICAVLEHSDVSTAVRVVEPDDKVTMTVCTPGGNQQMWCLNELGIYQLVFTSRLPEAKDFRRWVFNLIKEARQLAGLASFQVFKMLDKEHQKVAMSKIRIPVKINYVKANTIADKCVSSLYGYPKMLKKSEMTQAMLVDRQPILDSTVDLMNVVEDLQMKVSVSETIYKRYL
jgi:prophage antirepressor-like protein